MRRLPRTIKIFPLATLDPKDYFAAHTSHLQSFIDLYETGTTSPRNVSPAIPLWFLDPTPSWPSNYDLAASLIRDAQLTTADIVRSIGWDDLLRNQPRDTTLHHKVFFNTLRKTLRQLPVLVIRHLP